MFTVGTAEKKKLESFKMLEAKRTDKIINEEILKRAAEKRRPWKT